MEREFEYGPLEGNIQVYIDDDLDRWVSVTAEHPRMGFAITESSYQSMESDTEAHMEDEFMNAMDRMDNFIENYMDIRVKSEQKADELIQEHIESADS